MTSSGKCCSCDKIATMFRYNNPRLDPNNINDGHWLCDDHDYVKHPGFAQPSKNQFDTSTPGNQYAALPRLSRQERRAEERKLGKFAKKRF